MIALVAGCGGGEGPTNQESLSPGVTVSPSSGTPSPTPTVALRVPHTLVFSASGTADVISISYELDGRENTDRSVSLPWRKVVEVPADGRQHPWKLTLKHGSGRAELIALFNGAVTGQTRGAGTGTGTLQVGGTVRG